MRELSCSLHLQTCVWQHDELLGPAACFCRHAFCIVLYLLGMVNGNLVV